MQSWSERKPLPLGRGCSRMENGRGLRSRLTILLLSLYAVPLYSAEGASIPAGLTESNPSTRMKGSCILMNLPGAPEGRFTPCRELPLQLLFEQNKRTIFSVIRTDREGTFSFEIPQGSGWRILPLSKDLQEKVDFIANHDGTHKVVVILRPKDL